MSARDNALNGGIVVGIGLVLLGIAASVATDFASVTSLIPSVVGVVFVAVGLVGRRTDREREAVLALLALSVLGFAGTLRMLPAVIELLTGGSVDSTVATAANGLMALGALVVIALSGYALVQSRR